MQNVAALVKIEIQNATEIWIRISGNNFSFVFVFLW